MFRRGQWVTLKETIEVVAAVIDGDPIKKTLPAGTLGIHHSLDDDRKYQHADGGEKVAVSKTSNPDDPNQIIRHRNFPEHYVGFHQVEPTEGLETLRAVALDPALLVPVTDRNQIPGKRLSTMSEDWTPKA